MSSSVDPRRLKEPPSPLNTKLTRASTARPLLYTKHNKEVLGKLADIIQETQQVDSRSTKGLLPVEAAYTVMKRVIEAAGEPLIPVGMSTFNRLQSLRTDPALKVLKSRTWRDFFSDGVSSSPHHSSSFPLSLQPSSANHHHPSLSTGQEYTILRSIYLTLCERIEVLWRELKIPLTEQSFYRKGLFSVLPSLEQLQPSSSQPPPMITMHTCRELASYLDILLQHKRLTKHVVTAIRSRQTARQRCLDVLVALHRKFLSSNHSPHLSSQQVFWKEELLFALDELRCATLAVIRDLQAWRTTLWRPHPFIFQGRNILLQMQEDMSFLLPEGGAGGDLGGVGQETGGIGIIGGMVGREFEALLGMVGLSLPTKGSEDLLGILFYPIAQQPLQMSSQETGGRGTGGEGAGGGGAGTAGQEYIAQLLDEFRHNLDQEELHLANRVVLEEHNLQRAVYKEQFALQEKGVFIPLLRAMKDQQQIQGQQGQSMMTGGVGMNSILTSTTGGEGGQVTAAINKQNKMTKSKVSSSNKQKERIRQAQQAQVQVKDAEQPEEEEEEVEKEQRVKGAGKEGGGGGYREDFQ